jgi:WD40 repeat protein
LTLHPHVSRKISSAFITSCTQLLQTPIGPCESDGVLFSCEINEQCTEVLSRGIDRKFSTTYLVQLWDLRAKKSVQTLEDQFQILSVCISDAGDEVFSSSIDNTIKVCILMVLPFPFISQFRIIWGWTDSCYIWSILLASKD